jgi:hypothetical protein
MVTKQALPIFRSASVAEDSLGWHVCLTGVKAPKATIRKKQACGDGLLGFPLVEYSDSFLLELDWTRQARLHAVGPQEMCGASLQARRKLVFADEVAQICIQTEM